MESQPMRAIVLFVLALMGAHADAAPVVIELTTRITPTSYREYHLEDDVLQEMPISRPLDLQPFVLVTRFATEGVRLDDHAAPSPYTPLLLRNAMGVPRSDSGSELIRFGNSGGDVVKIAQVFENTLFEPTQGLEVLHYMSLQFFERTVGAGSGPDVGPTRILGEEELAFLIAPFSDPINRYMGWQESLREVHEATAHRSSYIEFFELAGGAELMSWRLLPAATVDAPGGLAAVVFGLGFGFVGRNRAHRERGMKRADAFGGDLHIDRNA